MKNPFKSKPPVPETWVPSGHFYSPIPDLANIRKNEGRIWGYTPSKIEGVDLNIGEQLELIEAFSEYYKELPFEANKKNGLLYYYKNIFFTYTDAIILYSMIRHLRPKKIIEAGSGFSSAVMLDTNMIFFQDGIGCTFIEPYPERLLSITEKREKNFRLIPADLQTVDIGLFKELQRGDILFIDSTHVSKINSDVNYILFEILPVLKSGVYIHFHDIFYPFEYPKEWVYEGRAWNEAYILRAFLQYNEKFRLVLFNDYLHKFHRDIFQSKMPLCLENQGGSIWIKSL